MLQWKYQPQLPLRSRCEYLGHPWGYWENGSLHQSPYPKCKQGIQRKSSARGAPEFTTADRERCFGAGRARITHQYHKEPGRTRTRSACEIISESYAARETIIFSTFGCLSTHLQPQYGIHSSTGSATSRFSNRYPLLRQPQQPIHENYHRSPQKEWLADQNEEDPSKPFQTLRVLFFIYFWPQRAPEHCQQSQARHMACLERWGEYWQNQWS